MFDKQIEKLFKLIDSQLQSLFQKLPNEQVVCLFFHQTINIHS